MLLLSDALKLDTKARKMNIEEDKRSNKEPLPAFKFNFTSIERLHAQMDSFNFITREPHDVSKQQITFHNEWERGEEVQVSPPSCKNISDMWL